MGRRATIDAAKLGGASLLWCALVVGCSFLSAPWSTPATEYTVRSGDTVYEVATRFGVSPEGVLKENGIVDPKTLQVGAVLRIPHEDRGGAPIPSELATERAPRASLRAVGIAALKAHPERGVWPVENARLTSRFGYRRFRFHEGLDLSAPEGTPVRAAFAGVVVYAGAGIKGYGNTVVVRHEGRITVYAHNAKNLVAVGDEVAAGEQIATVGQTGRASGPHCHFEVRVRNEEGRYAAVDPQPFF